MPTSQGAIRLFRLAAGLEPLLRGEDAGLHLVPLALLAVAELARLAGRVRGRFRRGRARSGRGPLRLRQAPALVPLVVVGEGHGSALPVE